MDFFIEKYTYFLVDNNIPYTAGFFLWYTLEFIVVAVLMMITVLIFVLAERKILAVFTLRKGPNRVGPAGSLQTVADALKLLFKEDIIPDKADKTLFTIAPVLVFVPVFIAWLLLPLASGFLPIKSEVGVLLFITVMLMPTLGILLAGYASCNKYSMIGALRICIQTISYEIPMLLTIMGIVILAGSMSLREIVTVQYNHGFLSWFCFPSIIGFAVFFITALAEMNRTPFDFPEAESELVEGYNTEYSGMKFAMFFLGEYAASFIICAFAVTLFFGGYLPPVPFFIANFFEDSSLLYGLCLTIEQFFWLISKTVIMLLVVIWIRATLPRFRSDMLAILCWKYLFPLSVINLIAVCLIKLGGFYG